MLVLVAVVSARLAVPSHVTTAKLAPPAGQPNLPKPAITLSQGPGAPTLPSAEFSGPWSDAQTDEKPKILDRVFDGRPKVLGETGPGVGAQHLADVQKLADEIGAPLFIHGSRQTGKSVRTGKSWRASSDLDLGVVGGAEELLRSHAAPWRHVADAHHAPMMVEPTVDEALAKGHAVVLPRKSGRVFPSQAQQELQSDYESLATREQLVKLNETQRGDGEAFSFALIGDAEPGRFWFSRKLFNRPGIFSRLLKSAQEQPVDFIVQLGDMVSRGTAGRFRKLLSELKDVAKPYLTVIGNHDRRKPHGVTDSRLYRALFGGTNYWFERGGWRFIVLDSSAGKLTRDQLEWLEKDALDTPRRKIVLTHVPPAPLPWTSKGLGGFKPGARRFMDLMAEHRVERVYVGHVHGFAVHEDRGVRYVLTGGGGSPLFPAPVQRREHHFLTVTAGPDGVSETLHTPDGKEEALP